MEKQTFTAGYCNGKLTDRTRSNWSGTGPRPVTWSAWYPVRPETQTELQLVGPTGRPFFQNGPVAEGAPIAENREEWPLVLLSHGTGGSALGVGWFGRRLAEAGFIVVGANHHGNTANETYCAEGFLSWWERSRDLSFLADYMLGDHPFSARIDPDKIYAAGHSLGGHTVIASTGALFSNNQFLEWYKEQPGPNGPREFPDLADHLPRLEKESQPFRESLERHAASYRDPRIKAAFAMAPAPTVRGFLAESLSAIEIPVFIQTGGADTECPVETCTNWLGTHNPDFSIEILPGETGHYVYLSEATNFGREEMPDITIDPPTVNRSGIHDHAAATAIRHFRATF